MQGLTLGISFHICPIKRRRKLFLLRRERPPMVAIPQIPVLALDYLS